MTVLWRQTLETLLAKFRATAAQSNGLYHVMTEVADDERERMSGPPWFQPHSNTVKVVNGEPLYSRWDCTCSSGLPGVEHDFREPTLDEEFSEDDRVIRDQSGVVRAVPVPAKLRSSYFCGQRSEVVKDFESLANVAAKALTDASGLAEHYFAQDLVDIFRTPRGGIRQVFGEITQVPNHFIGQGWACGVLQFENGVLIDSPISEMTPDASNWMLLLHRLGWRKPKGSGLSAHRALWHGNTEVAWGMLDNDWSHYPDGIMKSFANISKTSYYSVLGNKECPLDVNLASALAIQVLLADLESSQSPNSNRTSRNSDYAGQSWNVAELPQCKSVSKADADESHTPVVGLLVATDIEKQAVLKRIRPPKNKRSVLQVFEGSNTYYAGRLGLTDVVVVMSQMGSTGRDSSTIVTSEFLEKWNLKAVIMVGIAFGKDAEKQMIGGVLVSDRIISYEPQRLGAESNQDRGEILRAGVVLLNRFRNILGWTFLDPNSNRCSFQVGPILSGEKLVDNLNTKADLFDRFPTAIGGEMEGAGFASAAERKNCEWIVVKAICDWGDGSKNKEHQGFAAAAAVDLVEHVLNQDGVIDSIG